MPLQIVEVIETIKNLLQVIVGRNLVTLRSKKKKVVVSSVEALFREIAKGIVEVLWLRKLMSKLGFMPLKSCKLSCDNKATISIFENSV